MKISVLVPVYKVEKYIQRCAESLFTQSDIDDVEFIFVNDASPDKSIDELMECINDHKIDKEHYKIINHPINKGLAAARNTGLDNAKGDYILLLDSDDTLAKNCIKALKHCISSDTPDIVVFGMQFIYPSGQIKTVRGNYVSTNNKEYLNDIITRKCLVTACGKLYSKNLFKNVRFIEGLNYGEDYATLPRLVYFAKHIKDISGTILYNYYQDNETSYTKTEIGSNHINNICKAVDILGHFFLQNNCENSTYYKEILKIRNKVFLLEYVSKPYRDRVLGLFPEVNDISVSLPLKHRIVWELGRRNQSKLLNIYLDLSHHIKQKYHI